MNRNNFIIMSFFLFLFIQGCSISRLAVKKAGQTLSNQQSTVFTGEDDPELVRDALPFTMKLYETILETDSTNADLFLATGKLFCLYAQAFILFPADTLPDSLTTQKKVMKKRAKKLLLRARDYCLQGLELHHPGFTNLIKSKPSDSALALTNSSDTSLLYWCSASWMAAISADRADLALAMTIKKAASLMIRVTELNDRYDNGSAHEILCAYLASIPKSVGGSDETAGEHFQKAVYYSSGQKISPFVTYATSLSLKNKKRDEFIEMLNNALSVNIQKWLPLKLQNTIYQQRARWMLSNVERYFPPQDSSNADK